jgi:hypothetical protein
MRFFKITLFCLIFAPVLVQGQANGDFTIQQSVIAAGGASALSGGSFSFGATSGQTAAGANMNNGDFVLQSGFWSASNGTTAAQDVIAGRVFNGKNGIIRRVSIRLTDLTTGAERFAQTASDGSFRFESLEIGKVYLVRAESKNFVFTPDSYLIQLTARRDDVNFRGWRILF